MSYLTIELSALLFNFTAKKLKELIEPCNTRISNVEGFLKDIDPTLEYEVLPIYDIYGPTIHDPTFQVFNLNFINVFVRLVFLNFCYLDDYFK